MCKVNFIKCKSNNRVAIRTKNRTSKTTTIILISTNPPILLWCPISFQYSALNSQQISRNNLNRISWRKPSRISCRLSTKETFLKMIQKCCRNCSWTSSSPHNQTTIPSNRQTSTHRSKAKFRKGTSYSTSQWAACRRSAGRLPLIIPGCLPSKEWREYPKEISWVIDWWTLLRIKTMKGTPWCCGERCRIVLSIKSRITTLLGPNRRTRRALSARSLSVRERNRRKSYC